MSDNFVVTRGDGAKHRVERRAPRDDDVRLGDCQTLPANVGARADVELYVQFGKCYAHRAQ